MSRPRRIWIMNSIGNESCLSSTITVQIESMRKYHIRSKLWMRRDTCWTNRERLHQKIFEYWLKRYCDELVNTQQEDDCYGACNLRRITLVSVLASSHNSIPSPQCALGTTPHLSIQKKAKKGRERQGEERDGEENVQDSKRCEEWQREKEEKQRDNTLLRHRKRKHVTPSTIKDHRGVLGSMGWR